PKIAVEQARLRRVPDEELVETVEKRVRQVERVAAQAVAPRERELVLEPPLAEELGPARERAVRLRRAADVIVAVPAERIADRAMKLRKRDTDPARRVFGLRAELDPLERQERVRPGNAAAEHGGNRDGAGAAQCVETVRLRLEAIGRVVRLEL